MSSRNDLCENLVGRFIVTLMEKALYVMETIPCELSDFRSNMFFIICMCSLCDPSGSLVLQYLSLQFLSEESLLIEEKSSGDYHPDFLKAIFLTLNLKLSTVLVHENGCVCVISDEEKAAQNTGNLSRHMQALSILISSSRTQCEVDQCYICSIYSSASFIPPTTISNCK